MIAISARRLVTAAALALALGAAAIGTVPAQAQSFSFGFSIGKGNGFSLRTPHRLCLLTDRGLRRAIGDQGYSNIYLNVANRGRIQARASQGRWVYLLVVDTCTGRVLDRQRLRHR